MEQPEIGKKIKRLIGKLMKTEVGQTGE